MTIRDKVEGESPNGRVLFLEDLRKCLGIGASDCDTPTSDNLSASVDPTKPFFDTILIGHDLRGDFPKMHAEGIKFDPHLYYFGCIDTYVVIEDTHREGFGRSLGRLMEYYGLAKGRIVKPKALPASKAKFVFYGGHNAGNDAVAALKVSLAQALDSDIKTMFCGESDDLTDEILNNPLPGIQKNMILIAYDSEGVESNRYDEKGRPIGPATTEHGFAWLKLADVADIPPGKNGINWHPYIRARHWLNWEYRNFANYKYVAGNPRGFWKEYGATKYYHESEGPTPFHKLFEELAGDLVGAVEGVDGIEKVTKKLELTTLGGDWPAVGGSTANIGGEMTKEVTNSSGKQPAWGGKGMGSRKFMTCPRGKEPDFGGTAQGLRENPVTNKGNARSWAQVARASTSNI